jgi:hypothetical protein
LEPAAQRFPANLIKPWTRNQPGLDLRWALFVSDPPGAPTIV